MERTRFSRRNVLWILIAAVFLLSWSINWRRQQEKRRQLIQAENNVATLQAKIDALEQEQAQKDKQRRAAGITD